MSIIASIRGQIVPVHREGLPFIGIFALVSLILFWLWSPLGWLGTVMTIWCALFFRDPDRVTPTREGLVVEAQVPQPLGARALEELEVFGVVDDTARIRVLEVDAHRERIREELRLQRGLHGDARHVKRSPLPAAPGTASPKCR